MYSNSPRNLKDLIERLKLAWSRHPAWSGKFSNQNCPPVLIVSPGGVASTELMKHIARFVETNSPVDKDGLKHRIQPPSNLSKAVLITGDPREVSSSLRRRGYVGIHSAKMGSTLGVLLRGNAQQTYFERLVLRQRQNFSHQSQECLVLDYGEAFEACEKLAEFLEIPVDEFCSNYPRRRERRKL